MAGTYKVVTEGVKRISHDSVTDVRIERIKRADIDPYSKGDWLVITDGNVTTHFPDQEHINADYIEDWFNGFIKSITE